MLFAKTSHKGIFVKEIFAGEFIEESNEVDTQRPDTRILVISENSLEMFNYFYDGTLRIPFLEPNLTQDLSLHILDAKIMFINDIHVVVLLTTCGLVIMKYSNENKTFVPICSEILNINCEERHKLMYLSVDERNENLFGVHSFSFDENYNLVFDTKGLPKLECLDILFNLINSFTFQCNLNNMVVEDDHNNNINKIDFKFYKFILSPFGNFFFSIGELGIICHQLQENSHDCKLVWKKMFTGPNILCSHLTFENFIQFVTDKNVLIFQEDVYNKKISNLKINQGLILNKKIIRISPSDYYFLYYDHKMNIEITKYNLEPDTINQTIDIVINSLNNYSNNSFFCLDSAIVNNYENIIYSLSGLKGSSKLVRLEKKLNETKLESFDYMPCIGIQIVEMKNKTQILYFSSADKTKIMKFTTTNQLINVEIPELEKINEKTINVMIFLQEVYSHICEKSILVYQMDSDFTKLIEINKYILLESERILIGQQFIYNNNIYYILYFNTAAISMLHYDNNSNSFIERCKVNFSFEISCFDFILQEDSENLFLIICTYNNRIEMYNFSFFNNSFNFASSINLENNEQTEIVPESVRIYNRFVCISTRTGEFCLFSLTMSNNEYAMQQLLTSMKMEERKVLTITDVKVSSVIEQGMQLFNVNLHNSSLGYSLQIKYSNDDLKNVKINKYKYLIASASANVSESKETKNSLNFLKNFKISNGIDLTLYQNNSRIVLSHFSKPFSTYLPDEILNFGINKLARRVTSYDDKTIIILIEDYANDSSKLISNTILIYSSNNNNNQRELLIEDEVKINTIKFIDITYINTEQIGSQDVEHTVRYLGICGQYLEKDNDEKSNKGFLFIYESMLNVEGRLVEFKLIRKLNVGNQPIYDFCQIRDHIVISSDNGIGTIKLELDHKLKKLAFTGQGKQPMLNKIISLFAIPNSYAVIVGDSNESFSLVEYEPRKNRFETIAADLSLRSLYKAIPDEGTANSVLLLQKNGVFSKFRLKDEIYKIQNSFDTKEFINKCHVLKPYYVCTTILGSLVTFLEITQEELNHSGLTMQELNEFQSSVFKIYSKFIFKKELSIEQLRNMEEPMKNVFLIDIFESLTKSDSTSIEKDYKSLPNFEKIKDFLQMISASTDNII